LIEALLAALAGLLIGSFLNVCIYRLPLDLSVVAPRSYCPECDHGIAWYDNVPILSYIVVRGRCRHCQVRISFRYPLVEFLTAACFFTAVWLRPNGIDPLAIKYCVFTAIVIALIFTDAEERILPDEFTLGGIAVGLVFAWFIKPEPGQISILRFFLPSIDNPQVVALIEAAFAAAFSSLSLWLVGFVYGKLRHREVLGLGDVKMVAMIGAFLGLQQVLLTLIVGSLLGSLVGLLYIYFTRRRVLPRVKRRYGTFAGTYLFFLTSKYQLPFGAFLGIGAIAVGFLGEIVIAWYRHIL
jgi:leader peptidase (prepilin peptidase)/N-methyltransferase